jgi:hypothetical protein
VKQVYEFYFAPPWSLALTTKDGRRSAWNSRPNQRLAGRREEIGGRGLWRTGFLSLLMLFCSLPLVLSGCGGQVVLGSGPRTLVASSSNVNFGDVPIGQTASMKVSLVNRNVEAIHVTQLSMTGQSFSVREQSNLPITLAAGSTYSLSVQFDPVAAGVATGQLTVTSSSSTSPLAAISLTGTGTARRPTPKLDGLFCTSWSITGSATDACMVTLTGAAPSGGLSVSLASNNAAVSVPTTVTVPADATSATFTATASWVANVQWATLTASAGDVSEHFTLRLNASFPILRPSATSMAFGNVAVNATAKQSLVLWSKGDAPVTVSAATVTGAAFKVSGVSFPLTLNPGQTARLTVEFKPATTGPATGQLTISSDSSTGAKIGIGLSGIGTSSAPPLALSGFTCSRASITGPGTDACTVTLTAPAANGGLRVSLTSSNPAITVPAAVTVPANGTIAYFTATVSGVTTAQTVTLTASAGSVSKSFVVRLNPSAPTLSVNATTVAFGKVPLNTPATQSVVLTSTGNEPVTVSSATVTGPGFTLYPITFPITLYPGRTATLAVQFDPTVVGAATGKLTIISNSSTGATAVISLSGTGTSDASFEVKLSWEAPSASADPVVGYNIYRSTGGGSTSQLLNSSEDTATTYVDITVQSGITYDYTVESVDASGVESAPSNTVTVTVPQS